MNSILNVNGLSTPERRPHLESMLGVNIMTDGNILQISIFDQHFDSPDSFGVRGHIAGRHLGSISQGITIAQALTSQQFLVPQ